MYRAALLPLGLIAVVVAATMPIPARRANPRRGELRVPLVVTLTKSSTMRVSRTANGPVTH